MFRFSFWLPHNFCSSISYVLIASFGKSLLSSLQLSLWPAQWVCPQDFPLSEKFTLVTLPGETASGSYPREQKWQMLCLMSPFQSQLIILEFIVIYKINRRKKHLFLWASFSNLWRWKPKEFVVVHFKNTAGRGGGGGGLCPGKEFTEIIFLEGLANSVCEFWDF